MPKRNAKDYVNKNTVHTIKVLEALEGANFEPVKIKRIEERAGLPYDKCRRVLITLEMLGWATQNDKEEWSSGAKILRFANRYSELLIANSIKKESYVRQISKAI